MGRIFNNNLFLQENGGGGAGGTTNYDDLTNKPKVNGVILSGNKTSADLGITTLTPFPSTWPTNGKFEDLLAVIRNDTTAIKGASFLGEVTFDDLPANLGNAEVKVEILEGTTSATKVIHSVITSGNREPYRWEYTSWNSGNSNSGWISFQLPLTAGDGISIENNVISTTGGNVYTQNNLLAGNGIEIVDEPVEGGIDNHTLACWHFDEDLEPIKFDSQLTSDVRGTIKQDYYKFGNGSCSGPDITIMNRGLNTSDFTVDYFFMPKDYLGGKRTYIGDVSIYINGQRVIIYFNNNNIYEFSLEQYGIWTHFAIQRKDLIYTIYVNGQSVFQSTEALTTRPATLFEAATGGSIYFYIDELRISDIARPLTPDGKFPVPTKPYSIAEPTGNKVVNNTITKTSQLTNDSGFLTSVPENLVTTDSYQGITGRKDFADLVNFNGGMRASTIQLTNNEPVASVSGDATLFGHPDMGIEIRYNKSVNINTRHTNSGTIRPATLNGKQIATVDDIAAASSSVTSVNTKTGNVVLTGADIQTTYTYNSKETTTTVNAFADAVFHNIDNVTALIPTKAVTSDNVTKIVKLTQAEYDQLETKDDSTFYAIVG